MNKFDTKSRFTKNLWCRNTIWKHITNILKTNIFKETNGCLLRDCKFSSSDCRGAHSTEEIQILPHINKYNQLNKSKYNWVELYLVIINSINNESNKVILESHKQRISNISKLNFIELIQLWRELACYYRKLAKELPNKPYDILCENESIYKYKCDVPSFNLSDFEDVSWAFERLTRICPTQEKIYNCIKSKTQITIWDLCLATGINCKEGIHNQNEMICYNDFLNGNCSCSKIKDINIKKIDIQNNINLLLDELANIQNENVDFELNKKIINRFSFQLENPKVEINKKINMYKKQIEELTLNRKIHYTDNGMIPFENQYREYLLKEEIKNKNLVKESWNHELINNSEITKTLKIVKLVKPGKGIKK